MSDCVFCTIEKKRIIFKDELFFVIRDIYPVTNLHTLIIPNRHIVSFFDLIEDEKRKLNQIIEEQRTLLLSEDISITGFNIGVNDGEDAGQTVMHCHIHLIPRRKGDVKNPRGGVRGVIPEMQGY
ncbi:HIT family protein [Alphaproteobacteria bacterium]|nr:HIT family protein [Alphaproteobacteria bacterium]